MKRSGYQWVLPSLLIAFLLGCGTRDDRVVARAKALALAGKSSQSLHLLTNYLVQYPHATEPRRAKILLAIQTEQSEEALIDYAAISDSQAIEDTALLHLLALGLIRDAWQRHEGVLRARAAAAMTELADPSSDWLLKRGLDHPDPTVRALAAKTVGRTHGLTLQVHLQRLLDDPEPFVRAEAAWAIGQLGALSDQSFLRRALVDRDAQVRIKVGGAPCHIG
ncbi:MAG: HEAT repeat domain-containing protein [Candidatus Methylomirabilis sp.]|nr:HEAT repeat domain-containing protein [Candidatus Methylomirabilis sp.]